MSHVVNIGLRIRDLDALEAALPPELVLRRGQKTHAWWGRFVGDSTPPPGRDPKDYGKCEHAIGRRGVQPADGPNGEWEIGLVPALDGDGFDTLCDTFGETGRRLTQHIPAIKREYAAGVASGKAMAKLKPKGWTLARENLANGRIRLRVRHR